jgi:signal peptidase II
MGASTPSHLRLGLTVAAIVAVLDQLTKYWLVALSGVVQGGRLDAGPFVSIVNQRNPGISYSLFEMNGLAGQLLLAAIALAVSAGIVVWLARGTSQLAAVALGLILGGAIGNAIDRPLRGGVIDFLALHAGGYQWYVFNVADVAIVAGVIGLLYESLQGHRKNAANSL